MLTKLRPLTAAMPSGMAFIQLNNYQNTLSIVKTRNLFLWAGLGPEGVRPNGRDLDCICRALTCKNERKKGATNHVFGLIRSFLGLGVEAIRMGGVPLRPPTDTLCPPNIG